jgi:hypothetical protein
MVIAVEPFVPKSDGDFVAGVVRKYESFLPRWVEHITVTIDTDEESIAEIRVMEQYRRATITLGRNWATSFTNLDQEALILHELMHLYTTPVACMGKEAVRAFFPDEETPGTRLAWDAIDRACERATEDLAQMILRNRAGFGI